MMQPKGLQQRIGEIASHHYIEIEKKLEKDTCLMTIGLRSDQKKTGESGIVRYLGTEILSPDFTDSKCTGLMNKCEEKCDNDDCLSICEKEKGQCLGANIFTLSSGQKILRGSIKNNYSDNEDYHNLNLYQVNIINWFLENMRKVDDGRSTQSYVSNLPFTFSFTPDFCSVVDWGPQEYYNCQKFVSVFHNQAKRIWDVLKEHIVQVEGLEPISGETGFFTEEGHDYWGQGWGGRRKKRKSRKKSKSKKRKSKKRKSKKRKSKRSKRRKRRTKRTKRK